MTTWSTTASRAHTPGSRGRDCRIDRYLRLTFEQQAVVRRTGLSDLWDEEERRRQDPYAAPGGRRAEIPPGAVDSGSRASSAGRRQPQRTERRSGLRGRCECVPLDLHREIW
jgi:hypothetical protein